MIRKYVAWTSALAGLGLMFQALAAKQVTAAETTNNNPPPFYSASGGAGDGLSAAESAKHKPLPFAQPAGPGSVVPGHPPEVN